MACPRRASLVVREIEGDLLVHDQHTGSVHRLNSVAALIWHLCDGKRDRAAITAEVAAIFDQPHADIVADVDEILARFNEAGLVYYSKGDREDDLLLRCVRTAISCDVSDARDADQLASDINWVYVVEAARYHGVTALLYQGLRDIAGDAVPGEAMSKIARRYRANLNRNRLLLEHLLEVLALFERNDIPAIPLKGPVLAESLYGHVGLREFGDLDILIPADRAARARNLLETRGCSISVVKNDSLFAEYGKHRRVKFDLQWGFGATRFHTPIDINRMWRRAERVSVSGATIWQPTPRDLFILLNAHGAKHCWSRLKWIADIAAFLERHRNLQWRSTMDEAAQLGGTRLTLLGTYLAIDLLGAAAPEELLPFLQTDRTVSPLATTVRRHLFSASKKPRGAVGSYGNIEAALLHISSCERLREKLPQIRYLLCYPFRTARASVVPNEHDRAFIALPRCLRFLYYVVRPVRLTAQYAAEMRQRVHRYSSH